MTPTQKQEAEIYLRSVEEKLKVLHAKGINSISTPLLPNQRILGICRDFSVIATALCREVGIAARPRCGFADYLEEGLFIDHWVLETYNDKEQRWVMVDVQLDELQREELNCDFDSNNVPASRFINAAEAWLGCRHGNYDPSKFGIYTYWGYEYLACNLILDANALLKMPLYPWDYWEGYKNLPIDQWNDADYESMDTLAHAILQVDKNPQILIKHIKNNPRIKAPSDLSVIYNGFQESV